MAENWTAEQRQAIELRHRNLLVSAAAGSGKTAVLTARILAMVTDQEHPVDIDRILVVTFTKAAAAEMRDRIRKAIRDKAEEEPGNIQLRRQLSLLSHAQITTIDSFLNYVVRSNYDQIDIDPSFRIADEGEVRLLQSDVFRALLEERYTENDEAFLRFSETISSGKTDEKMEALVYRIFRVTESMVDPEAWYQTVLQGYQVEDEAALNQSAWCCWYLSYNRKLLRDAAYSMERIADAASVSVPGFVPMLLKERDQILHAAEFTDYTGMLRAFSDIHFDAVRAKAVGADSKDPALEQLKADREKVKKQLKSVTDEQMQAPALISLLQEIRPTIETLIQLTRDFSERFREEKRRRMIADFSDVARMALRILRTPEGTPTETARQFAAYYEEIMIDEYQDSNEIQEAILTAVSREADGQPNIFMVGDVKQSIYRFRMARPELFNKKYREYSTEDSLYQKVELHMNFRSRARILDCVNAFFFSLMQEDVGDISYDDNCALNACDSIFPEYEFREDEMPRTPFLEEPELLILNLDPEVSEVTYAENPDTEDAGELPDEASLAAESASGITDEETAAADPEDFDYSSVEWEARLVARKIRELMDPLHSRTVYDTDLKKYRPLRYGDIAILLRAGANWSDEFLEILTLEGIPASTEGSRGYYSSREVRLVLDLLTVIDNPVNDIPLAAVLHSPLFKYSSEELAVIRNHYHPLEQGLGFYGAVKNYAENGSGTLKERLKSFLELLESFRVLSHELPLSEFLRRIYRKIGLLYIVSAMPGGSRREANLRMLIAKAHDFEETSYHGVFQFIRYIDKLNSYALDTGEAAGSGENENAVRILTIHKSKGLEYPVVFLSGLGKAFNHTDEYANVVIHQDLGIGADLIDFSARTRIVNPMRKIFAKKLSEESRGEELRVLYVAMTRAREKLYMTGTVKHRQEMQAYLRILEESAETAPEEMRYSSLVSAKSMLEWLVRTYRKEMPVRLTLTDTYQLAADMMVQPQEPSTSFCEVLDHAEYLPEQEQRLREVLTAEYLYDDLYRTDATVSVSRLKQEHMQDALTEVSAEARDLWEIRSADTKIPPEEVQRISGARRGTLYHSVLEWLDPHEEIGAQLLRWEKEGLISAEEKATIDQNSIRGFLFSPLGRRFVQAYDAGRAWREKQFIIGVPVREIWKDVKIRPGDENELVMIQGIIDLYFEEDGGIILADYKTDRVSDPEALADMYREQLLLYRRALSMFTHLPVREMWIYSLTLGEAIRVRDME